MPLLWWSCGGGGPRLQDESSDDEPGGTLAALRRARLDFPKTTVQGQIDREKEFDSLVILLSTTASPSAPEMMRRSAAAATLQVQSAVSRPSICLVSDSSGGAIRVTPLQGEKRGGGFGQILGGGGGGDATLLGSMTRPFRFALQSD